jgi:nitrogenase molybdenum-iron protein beta chain
MSQDPAHIVDHTALFEQPEYVELLARKKREFEGGCSPEEVARIDAWTRTPEYREKNFARQALTVNPAKACQPLGAVFAAVGFEGTLPFVHGSQGCVAYYRSHLSRHFREPTSAVSSSMTEDAAVFGGLNNLTDGLQNANALYQPKMIHVSTTCMAEVIGDDLNAFIKTAKEKGAVPKELDVPFAHTPAFIGSHVTGYDATVKSVLQHFWEGRERTPGEGLNVILGFDGYTVANTRELKRILGLFGVPFTILADNSDVFDTPTDGHFRMYAGGTPLEAVKAALHAKATLSLQEACTEKTLEYVASKGQAVAALHMPLGLAGTDELLMKISELTGRPIPEELERERGRLVDAIADSQALLHGKRVALYGDPDLALGLTGYLLELGAEPAHVVCTNGGTRWQAEAQALLDRSPFGAGCKAWAGKDLWHLRSLMATEPVDLLIGDSHGKYLERDLGTPLVRIGFPIFDRHHHHRFPTLGYQGGLNVLVKLLDTVCAELDRKSQHGTSFDLIR